MKKNILFFLALCTCFNVGAQFNRVYDTNNSPEMILHGRVIETSDLNTVFVATSYNLRSDMHYAVVTKVGQLGLPIWDTHLSPYFAGEDLDATFAIVETEDRGILIAGYYGGSDGTRQPVLVKLDSNGNYLWSALYYNNGSGVPNIAYDKISLIRVADDPEEHYFIVYGSESDVRSGDCAVNVIKTDGAGTMLWSKKYYDVNWASSGFSVIEDVPGDIAYSPESRMYMINGMRQTDGNYLTREMFFFGIDNNGVLVTAFKSLAQPGYSAYHDMTYDSEMNVFAATCFFSGNIVGGCIASVVGLVTIDAALNIGLHEYYWDATHEENYGMSISKAQEGYVIGCFTSPCAGTVRYSGLLKVHNGGTPMWYRKYVTANTETWMGMGGSITCTPSYTGGEEYLLVSSLRSTTGIFTDCRAIRTDVNGEACSMVPLQPEHGSFDPQETVYDYYTIDGGHEQSLDINPVSIDLYSNHCDDGPPDEKSMQVDAGADQLAIFPSSVSLANPMLQVNGKELETCTVDILAVNGSLVFSQNLRSDMNAVLLPVTMSAGMYFAVVREKDGSVRTMQKISVTE